MIEAVNAVERSTPEPLVRRSAMRVQALDVARGLALLAMIAFHLTWDLDYFGLLPGHVTATPTFLVVGHAIAGCFLAIVGGSLALFARGGFAPKPYARRLALIGVAALAITLATWIVFPREYIFFGILHCIAVAGLVAPLFLMTPRFVVFVAAVLSLLAPAVASSAFFDHRALQWLGFGLHEPVTNDWAPFFPSFGFVLLGLWAGRMAIDRGWADALAGWRPRRLAERLAARGGRRSLFVYLIHQPVLLGLVFVAASLAGRGPPSEAGGFVRSCSEQCAGQGGDRAFCARVCGCLADRVSGASMWPNVLANALTPSERAEFNARAKQCVREIGRSR